MPHEVVISYSRRNREIADRLTALLRERGLDVWYDRMIKPGADWRDEIARAIADARVFLILFSSESNQSEELKKELSIADRRGLLIIPVRIEEVEPSGLFEYELARRQWFDIFDDWRGKLSSVVDYVVEVVAPESRPMSPEPPEPPKAPAPRAQATPAKREPPSQPARGFDRGSNPTPGQAGARLASPLVLLLPAIGALLGLTSFVLLGVIQDEDLAAGITPVFLVPGWTVIQVLMALPVAKGQERARQANLLVRAFAVVTVATIAFMFASEGGWYEAAQGIGGLMALVFVVFAVVCAYDAFGKGRKESRVWILPMLASAVIAMQWSLYEGRDLTVGTAALGGVGMTVGGVAYLAEAARRAGGANLRRIVAPS